MNKFAYYIFAVFALLLAWMAWPMFSAIFIAALVAISVNPLNQLMIRKLKLPPVLATIISVVVTFLFIVGPIFTLLGLIVDEALTFAQASNGDTGAMLYELEKLNIFGFEINFQEIFTRVQDVLKASISVFAEFAAASLPVISRFFFLFLVFLLFYFYFLKDGKIIVRNLEKLLPYNESQKDRLRTALTTTSKTLFQGYLLSALISGIMAGVGFAIFGVKGALIWGILAAILSLIPTVGALFVYLVGVVIVLALHGWMFAALFVGYYALVQVVLVENIIKPKLVDEQLAVHPLLVFIGLVGGVVTMGAMGALYGPVIVVLLVTMYEFVVTAKRI